MYIGHKSQISHRHRAQLALNRIIAIIGEDAAVKAAIAHITAKRMDKIADQYEDLAEDYEWRAEINANAIDQADQLDTQRCAQGSL